jgi:DNA-binding SARP family transcriptional activator
MEDLLEIRTLGGLSIHVGGQPVHGLSTRKVKALLVFLARTKQIHSREVLATLFWGETSQKQASASLRTALSNLRKHLAPFVLVNREEVSLSRDRVVAVDANTLDEKLTAFKNTGGMVSSKLMAKEIAEAVAMYRGDFLKGFHVRSSFAFDAWAAIEREMLHQGVIRALNQIIAWHQRWGEYAEGIRFAKRLLQIDPLNEEVHRKLMRMLSYDGQRGAALSQYETCQQILVEELGVAPEAATSHLHQQIMRGQLEIPAIPHGPISLVGVRPQTFLDERAQAERVQPVFVARNRELARLDAFLDTALNGQGGVVFVTGGPGRGKTALLAEFSHRAMEDHPEVLVASGNCNAYAGMGDPYLPFRDVLNMLTGDVEAHWAAGAITKDHAQRLWRTLPSAVTAILDYGPNLLEAFFSGSAFLQRAAIAIPENEPLLNRLRLSVERAQTRREDWSQSHLFHQLTKVFQTMADENPLVLLLDDLQWVDSGSTGLLFHLVQRLDTSRVLFVGAYRPVEVAIGRNGSRHPIDKVVHEFKRRYGDIWIDLSHTSKVEEMQFVNAYLETEPNRLGSDFRAQLHHHTGGHPLFTIELLRAMQKRGDLNIDEEGYWVTGMPLDWEKLPARVEGAIAERIDRLPVNLQRLLQIASVQGETFIAEVVADHLAKDVGTVISLLSGDLSKEHRLVRSKSVQQLGPSAQRLSNYQFHHYLFQKFLYNSLDDVQKTQIHEATGKSLEILFGTQTIEISARLARHFQVAGNFNKAVQYRLQAGQRALRLSAIDEAHSHLTSGLEALKALPEHIDRNQRELSLQLALGAALKASQGYAAPAVRKTYKRAHDLCQQVGQAPQLFTALMSLSTNSLVLPELETALSHGRQMLAVAKQAEDPLLDALAHLTIGRVSVHLGRFKSAHEHLDKMITFYDPHQHHTLAYIYSIDLGVDALAWDTWPLNFMGFLDQSTQRGQKAIALAQALDHPLSLTVAYTQAATSHAMRREKEAAKVNGELALEIAKEFGFVFFQAAANYGIGWALAASGLIEEGIERLQEYLSIHKKLGVGLYRRSTLLDIADIYLKAGEYSKAIDTLEEAEKTAFKSGERYHDAELYRLKGELGIKQGHSEDKIENSLRQAIQIAKQQNAKLLELRATTSLARLLESRGKRGQAYRILAGIYNWFSEGFEKQDLIEAKTLLEELATG